ncbi:MAG: DNA repair exonuclease [Caldilineaceae bacterium]|nr:DNA repair exonuclease [Caldilineaceae bacterium]
MQARFLHLADCHLGKWQYNQKERYNDFGRAFHHILDEAIKANVDFVILAGDLFEKRSIDALTLNQAMRGLEKLKARRIPCLAIEGNHERVFFSEQVGWLKFLALQELLILLDAPFEQGVAKLSPYTNRNGSYYDPIPGLRVHGLRYVGASTATAIDGYAQALAQQPDPTIEYTIFMAHAGLEGVLQDQGGLSHRQWSVLRPYVDYLALGHIHKPYSFGDWIYNPGSPENCSVTEAEWNDRGYFIVQVNTGSDAIEAGKHQATLHSNPRRPFHRFTFKTDLLQSPAELYERCRDFLERKARDLEIHRLTSAQRPVVELQLSGVLPFERSALDLEALEKLVQETFQPLVALVKNFTRTPELTVESAELLSRAELEHKVLTELLERDVRFRPQSEHWVALALTLKQLALNGASADAIVSELSNQLKEINQRGSAVMSA